MSWSPRRPHRPAPRQRGPPRTRRSPPRPSSTGSRTGSTMTWGPSCHRPVPSRTTAIGPGATPTGLGSPSMTANAQVPDRNLALDLCRVTEAAALAASRWMGRGDKEGADAAAVDAMRHVLDTVTMDGVVIIGEGEKDEAPMLFNGERIGNGQPPAADIAVDPIDGTTLTSLGRANAIAVIAVSDRGTMYDPGPCVYMEKIAVVPECAEVIDITESVTENLRRIAKAKHGEVRDLTAVILDRDRHAELITE